MQNEKKKIKPFNPIETGLKFNLELNQKAYNWGDKNKVKIKSFLLIFILLLDYFCVLLSVAVFVSVMLFFIVYSKIPFNITIFLIFLGCINGVYLLFSHSITLFKDIVKEVEKWK